MDLSDCSYSDLPYSKLFLDYINNSGSQSEFFETNPFDDNAVAGHAKAAMSGTAKTDYINSLRDYHKNLGISEAQSEALDKLLSEDALCIVTGQQLGIYGGPLYTIYKTMTAVLLAAKWEKKLNRPVVPVFWMADEDHDFDEIAWSGILGRDDYHKIMLNREGDGQPVADQLIADEFTEFREHLSSELFDTDFTDALWELLERCYNKGETHGKAFANLISEWFSHQGVLIAGSNHEAVKGIIAPDFVRSIESAGDIYDAIEDRSVALEQDYHRQVVNGDSNLFYLDDDNRRIKIHREENGNWSAGEESWTQEELTGLIQDKPHRFSPNVFLRPVIQDRLLPTLGYVAGPGETAYYAQMKKLYGQFELSMPVIFPRLSITLIESGIDRILSKLPFNICEYNQRIEDLESRFIAWSDTPDLEAVFGEWKQKIADSSEKPSSVINKIDPTLDGTLGKTVAGFQNELDRLKGKVYRSVKQQEETQLKRIEKIKINLFPDGQQERSVSPVYFMNKYGPDIWDRLLDKFKEEGTDLSHHHIIRL